MHAAHHVAPRYLLCPILRRSNRELQSLSRQAGQPDAEAVEQAAADPLGPPASPRPALVVCHSLPTNWQPLGEVGPHDQVRAACRSLRALGLCSGAAVAAV
jgi:hypothetical protein